MEKRAQQDQPAAPLLAYSIIRICSPFVNGFHPIFFIFFIPAHRFPFYRILPEKPPLFPPVLKHGQPRLAERWRAFSPHLFQKPAHRPRSARIHASGGTGRRGEAVHRVQAIRPPYDHGDEHRRSGSAVILFENTFRRENRRKVRAASPSPINRPRRPFQKIWRKEQRRGRRALRSWRVSPPAIPGGGQKRVRAAERSGCRCA